MEQKKEQSRNREIRPTDEEMRSATPLLHEIIREIPVLIAIVAIVGIGKMIYNH